MPKFEKKFLEFVEKNLFYILLVLFTIIGVIFRRSVIDYSSQDATYALLKWYDEIKNGGGLSSLANQVGNYNIIYQFLIALMTYVPIEPLHAYKYLSIIFDYALAVAVAYLVYMISTKSRKWKALIGYGAVVCSPIVLLNSSVWSQCDSIYTFFIILALIFLIKEKVIRACVFLGIAFAFKLQAIFIVPVFLYVWYRKRNFSFLNFLLVPAVLLFSGLPGVILGRGLFEPFKIYVEQADTYQSIFLNYPSFWAIFLKAGVPWQYELFSGAAKWLTVAILAIFITVWTVKKVELNPKNIVYMSMVLSFVCVLFLPAMHDRYGYLYEILAIVIVLIDYKTAFPAVALQIIGLYAYANFLFGDMDINYRLLSVVNLVVFGFYGYYLSKKMVIESGGDEELTIPNLIYKSKTKKKVKSKVKNNAKK